MPRPHTGHPTAHGRRRRANTPAPNELASSGSASDHTDASTPSAPSTSENPGPADDPPITHYTSTSGDFMVPGPRAEPPIGTITAHETVAPDPSIPSNPNESSTPTVSAVTSSGRTAPEQSAMNPDTGHAAPGPQHATQRSARDTRVTTAWSDTGGTTRKRSSEAEQLALPGMDEWVQEQLKRAPARSRAWAQRVAAIYGLELPDD